MNEISHLNSKFSFGKFKGCELGEVLIFSPSYVTWVVCNVSDRVCRIRRSAVEEMKLVFPEFMADGEFEELWWSKPDDSECESCYEYELNEEWTPYQEEQTYDRYAGTYAQDVMGYSDDDIDTIFCGEPDAYWNID